jgi:two-component system LytT family response regulator
MLSWQLNQYCPDVQIIEVCTDPVKALESIKSNKPDLVFMDIDMPVMNGFELLHKLGPVNFDVIFVTAFDQFAIKAFQYSAVDYLLKPVEADDLIKAVAKVQPKMANNYYERAQLLLDQIEKLKKNEKIKRIAISTYDSYHFIDVDEIICCESERNYTHIHFSNGKKLLISKTLKSIETILTGFDFFRIHQSFLINLNYVSKFNRDSGGYVLMTNGMNIIVAKTKREEFFNKFSKI